MEPQIYNAFVCRVFMAIASDEIIENLLEFRRHLAAPRLTEKFVKLTTISGRWFCPVLRFQQRVRFQITQQRKAF
jgi:hypothetical protein